MPGGFPDADASGLGDFCHFQSVTLYMLKMSISPGGQIGR
jgi:hypothetical protein